MKNKRFKFFLLFLLLLLTLLPCQTWADTIVLQGTITDSVTSAPIVGAQVILYWDVLLTVFTDSNGHFSVTGQQWPYTGPADIFIKPPKGHFGFKGRINIDGPFPMTFNKTLLPGGTVLQGKITDASTTLPIANATVTYDVDNWADLNNMLEVSLQTDLSGNYAFDCSYFREEVATAGTTGKVRASSNPGYISSETSISVSPPLPIAIDMSLTGTGTTREITIATDPTGLPITVDNISYTAPHTFSWVPNSVHTIAASSSLQVAGTKYGFNNWSDGGTVSHAIAVPNSGMTITATFTIQYSLDIAKNGNGQGTITGKTGDVTWLDCGTVCQADITENSSVMLTAIPSAGFYLEGWGGACLGNGLVCTLLLNIDKSVTATFSSIADFEATPRSGYAPFLVDLIDESLNSTVSWAWTFGDGATSTQQNPSHVYTQEGTYTVTLAVSSGSGPSTMTKTGYIWVLGCPMNKVWIENTTAFSDSLQTAYGWAFGGDSILMQAKNVGAEIILDQNKAIDLRGGRSCDYSNTVGYTVVGGPLIISGGTITLENIAIE